MNDNLISLAEAAELKDVDRSTIWRWIRRGLPAQRIGNVWVVDRDELVKFVPVRVKKEKRS